MEEQLNEPTYYAIKVVIIGLLWGICQSCLCSFPLCGQLKRLAISVTVAFV